VQNGTNLKKKKQ